MIITDKEIFEHFDKIIKPKYDRKGCFIKIDKDFDNFKKEYCRQIKDELINIGMESDRVNIFFNNDGNIDISIAPKNVEEISINFDFKWED